MRSTTGYRVPETTPRERALLAGSLLGDGTLEPYRDISARLRISHKIAHREYNAWFMEQTPSFGWRPQSTVTQTGVIAGRSISGTRHTITTAHHRDWIALRHAWYPGGVKAPPPDLDLSPETLAVWYMDDGTLGISRAGRARDLLSPHATLYASGFTVAQVQDLSTALRARYDLKSSVRLARGKPVLTFAGRIQVPAFFEIIGPVVRDVPCMSYKIDLDRVDLSNVKSPKR